MSCRIPANSGDKSHDTDPIKRSSPELSTLGSKDSDSLLSRPVENRLEMMFKISFFSLDHYTTQFRNSPSKQMNCFLKVASYIRVHPLFQEKSEGLFQDFSRIQIDFSRTTNFTINPFITKILKSILHTYGLHTFLIT